MTQLPPSRQHEVVAREHLVDLARDVEGEHRFLAAALGVAADHSHHRLHPLRKGAMRRVGHELVVLDEIDAALDELVDQFRRLGGGQPDAGLDDGAYERAFRHAGERARAGNPELRALVGAKQRRRQVEIEEAQSRDLAALEEVARDRGKDVRDGGAGVGERPGDRHLGAAEAALGWTCHRQARLLALVELGDALDPRRVQALDALGRRAGELDEGRGRGLARDHRRGLGKLDVGLDQVGGGEAVAHGSGPA